MPRAYLTLSGTAAGIVFASTIDIDETGSATQEVALPAGKAGTLTTRTDNDTGVATLSTGHGIVQTDVVDIYWSGGRRYGAVVDSVATNAVTFGTSTPGSGDNLPTTSTALVMTKQVPIDMDFDGADLAFFGITCDQRANVDIQSGALVVEVPTANQPYLWYTDCGYSNALVATTVAGVAASNGSMTAATLKIAAVLSST